MSAAAYSASPLRVHATIAVIVRQRVRKVFSREMTVAEQGAKQPVSASERHPIGAVERQYFCGRRPNRVTLPFVASKIVCSLFAHGA